MAQPQGFHTGSLNTVCKLRKAIYGLKQAPRAWFQKFTINLLRLGFQQARTDHSLFIFTSKTTSIYILIYVDDIIITSNSSTAIQNLIQTLHKSFPLKDLGKLDHFLGIEVSSDNAGGIHLSQTKYLIDILAKLNMSNAKPIKTPMAPSSRLTNDGTEICQDSSLYRSVVGALQYLTITRPYIAYTVNKLSQFMHHPLEIHWKAAKRLLRYLKCTSQHGLHYKKSSAIDILAYCDSDWASDQEDMRSTSRYYVYLGSNIVSWMAKKQRVVSRSSTEAEFRSLASLVAEIQYIENLLLELHIRNKQSPLIWCDNQGAVLLSANPVMHTKTKHFELDLWFVRERVARGQIQVRHILARFQVADLFTKSPSSAIFLELRDKLNVDKQSTLSLKGDKKDVKLSLSHNRYNLLAELE
ncbi:uncharacterized protein LOC109802814 [Cajanus cajan]|uniref:Copia protein n=1 Tax=Cajanus cajan TaxID=3821 RepID=A0A151TDH2_CAJCA|nr:uncharacterized protein LOC109802814 [Cajanus cajan]KYP65109.1 Copia protein [Cajanus cajan]